MAKNKVYRFFYHCQGRKKRAESAGYPVTVSALATVLIGAQVAPQRCPILRSSAAILPRWFVFATGRFFNVKMVGFSRLIVI